MAPERSTSNTPVGDHSHGQPHVSQAHSHSQHQNQGVPLGSSQSYTEPSAKLFSKIPKILPHERVFPIQIGSELFKLSGASISSDAPSYFSQYFLCQLETARQNGSDPSASIRTLYIDRDPLTFRDISLHLQGYHVSPRDATHFVRLFADAQFYSLPKLVSQLYEESIFMTIGQREFQIPRDLFSDPGNSPNFFSLGFAIFFSQKDDLFPGLDREGLIRPPSILPPSVPGRSADNFAELVHLLRGYPVDLRGEAHRASLLRDCRYFNFKGLEQRLIPHALAFNQARGRDEIVLRIEDILKSGISLLPDPLPLAVLPGADPAGAWVNYARPFVDSNPAELILEIGGENQRLHFSSPSSPFPHSNHNNNNNHDHHASAHPNSAHGPNVVTRVEFFRDARTRVTKLFEVIAGKLNLPPTTAPLGLLMATGGAISQPATPGTTPLSEDWVRCVVDAGGETSVVLDGARWTGRDPSPASWSAPSSDGAGGGGGMMMMMMGNDGTYGEDGASMGGGAQRQHHEQYATPTSGVGGGGGGEGGGGLFAMGSGGGGHVDSSPTGLAGLSLNNPSRKRRRVDTFASGTGAGGSGAEGGGGLPQSGYWIIKTGQWRLRIQSRGGAAGEGGGAAGGGGGVECVLMAVKLDAVSGERARNEARGFLNG